MNVKYCQYVFRLSPRYFHNRSNVLRSKKQYWRAPLVVAASISTLAFAWPVKPNVEEVVANFGGAIRFLRSLRIGLSISLDYYFSSMGLNENSDDYKPRMSRIHQRSAEKILKGCLLNGGCYIKLGQGLVAMDHVLPIEYPETLKLLQDECLKRKKDEVIKLFFEDFGKTPDEMFKCFEEEPIAAASLAQVFKAQTHDGQIVAVKIQYIDLQKRFTSDIATVEFLLKLVAIMHPDFNFSWIMEELKDALKEELDFFNEGKNGERCAAELKHLSFVYIPKIFWDYCSTRVLVAEFIDGFKINETDKLLKDGHVLADIDTKLFNAFGEQIFRTGFVHADPHPGNILVRKVNGKSQLILLDHGLYQYISDTTRINLSYMWKAIVLGDHKNMKKYSHELGVEDYEMFAEILTQIPLKNLKFQLKTKLTEEDHKFMTQFAKQRFSMVMDVLKTMPSTLLLVLRNLNTIRGIAEFHGNPIDRYTVLARSATQTAFGMQQSFLTSLYNFPVKIYFEIKLLTNKIGMWLQRTYFKILYFLGRSPDVSFIVDKLQ